MPNTNCLEGFKCPACGSEESFKIEATSIFTMFDDGSDAYENVEWENTSYCECVECHFAGVVSDFNKGE